MKRRGEGWGEEICKGHQKKRIKNIKKHAEKMADITKNISSKARIIICILKNKTVEGENGA